MAEKVDALFLIYRNKVVKENGDGLDFFEKKFKTERDAYYKERRKYEARIKYQEKHLPKEIKPENVCECGGHYISHINRHLETKKHKLFLCGK